MVIGWRLLVFFPWKPFIVKQLQNVLSLSYSKKASAFSQLSSAAASSLHAFFSTVMFLVMKCIGGQWGLHKTFVNPESV